MSSLMKMAGDRAHERTITMSTCAAGEERVIVEGRLVDRRLNEYYLMTGEKRPAGDIHHMVIRLLVRTADLAIEDVEVELVSVPREECHAIRDTLAVIKGERIVRGYSDRMRELLGGVKSCTHLVTLLIAMGPAALQGIFSNRSRKPMDLASMTADPVRMKYFMNTMVNTCYVWREDGPALARLRALVATMGGPTSSG